MTFRNIPLFLILFVEALQIADILLTHYGLKIGLTELNPIYGNLNNIPKLVLPLFSYVTFIVLRSQLSDKEKIYADLCFIIVWIMVVVFYITVLLWNTIQIFKVIKNGSHIA